MLALQHVPAFLIGTTIPCLPALIALVAWSEGGSKILRQYGARMMWEISGLVAVGVGFLLYSTLALLADEGANAIIIVTAAASAVPAVTGVIQRVQVDSPPLRITLAAGVSYLALEAGLLLGLGISLLVWTPKP